MVYPDTSFLCALYRQQVNSAKADARFAQLTEPLAVASLLVLEFHQSIRFQMGLNDRDKTKGFSRKEGRQMLMDFEADLESGALIAVPLIWEEVWPEAERMSQIYTTSRLHRLMDILHVGTALAMGAQEFLTFDANQKKLAQSQGLRVTI